MPFHWVEEPRRMDVRSKRLGGQAILVLQTLALALWLEAIVTLRWIYPGCFVPVFGWPLPNRTYSECCSLEWAVDWRAFLIDLSVYVFIAGALVVLLRLALRGHWKFVSPVLWVLLFASPIKLMGMSLWYSPLDVPATAMQPVGVSLFEQTGTCRNS